MKPVLLSWPRGFFPSGPRAWLRACPVSCSPASVHRVPRTWFLLPDHAWFPPQDLCLAVSPSRTFLSETGLSLLTHLSLQRSHPQRSPPWLLCPQEPPQNPVTRVFQGCTLGSLLQASPMAQSFPSLSSPRQPWLRVVSNSGPWHLSLDGTTGEARCYLRSMASSSS